jgi:hypothetical protein
VVLGFLLILTNIRAQVGINTETPKTTLMLMPKGIPEATSLIIHRLTGYKHRDLPEQSLQRIPQLTEQTRKELWFILQM